MLDCETAVGHEWIARQLAVAEFCAREWRVDVMRTAEPSAVDALIARHGQLLAVAEIKSRSMTLDELRQEGSYLVTFEKLNAGRDIAMRLRVPYLLVVGLDDAVLHWTVSNAAGEWLAPMNIKHTVTKKSCNGGSARRMNAYLLRDAARRGTKCPDCLRNDAAFDAAIRAGVFPREAD